MLIPESIALLIFGLAIGAALPVPGLLAKLVSIRLASRLKAGLRDGSLVFSWFLFLLIYGAAFVYIAKSTVSVHIIKQADGPAHLRHSYTLATSDFEYRFQDRRSLRIGRKPGQETIVINDTDQSMPVSLHHYSKSPTSNLSPFGVQSIVSPRTVFYYPHPITYFGVDEPPSMLMVQQGTHSQDLSWLHYQSSQSESSTVVSRSIPIVLGALVGFYIPFLALKRIK
jgi:hypothetical protein